MNFMARVICCVFFTLRMRRRKSISVGMLFYWAGVLIAPAVAKTELLYG